jgi:O-acetylhomoserine (thiol)-lyase
LRERREDRQPWLKKHPKVNWVNYAQLPDSKYNATAKKITKGKAPGIISFGIKGGAEAGAQFIDALQMILRAGQYRRRQVAGLHPASTTHRQLNPEELAKGRRLGRPGAHLGGHRAYRRHHRRCRAGARKGRLS